MQAIVVENLTKRFPPAYSGWRTFLQIVAPASLRALAGVSLQADADEVVAVVGANGAGKSTLLRILATLLMPTAGRALVAGFDAERQSAQVRRRIGYHSGADFGFYGRLTGRENLEFFALMSGLRFQEARDRIGELTEHLGLGPALDRQTRGLSSGTINRLGLARALIHRPTVLLLDEPTRSLDPLAAAEFRSLLKDIVHRHGTTVVFASHILSEVEELAGRVALIDNGSLIAYDKPGGLLAAAKATSLQGAVETLLLRASASGRTA
ncbi:MAG TPA: ABC transporter ATP-binding protein [Candidatus Acidoferrales bacterium]|nr:ABC transporter ATP-binding protein [Candidatus Acidoferrales bacterium]